MKVWPLLEFGGIVRLAGPAIGTYILPAYSDAHTAYRMQAIIAAVAAVASCFVGGTADADNVVPGLNYSTNLVGPPGQCFEIVQSSLLARETFRVDKCAGVVDVLVKGATGDSSWVVVPRENAADGDAPDMANPVKDGINYQLFISGVAARFTFLMSMRTVSAAFAP